MAEYLANAVQTVNLNEAAIFTASIPCNLGLVYHEDETGVFLLRGIANNCACSTRYQVTFNGNIAIPTGGAVGPIAVALTINGEIRPTSRAIVNPTAVETYDDVTSTAIITVPRGCCFSVSLRAVSGITPPETDTPAPAILLQNANIVINRVRG